MGDPVTMAMIGAGVGAVTNPKKPLQGALLGGALGGFGGAFANVAKPAATAMGTTAGGVPLAITGSTPGVALPSAALPASTVKLPATFLGDPGVMATPTMSMSLPNTLPFANPTMPGVVSTNASTGLIPSMTADVTMMDRFKALGQFGKENPMVGQVGVGALQNIMQTPPPAPSAGLLRGNPIPVEQQQMAMLQQPQITLI
jgi:hypothetical protein